MAGRGTQYCIFRTDRIGDVVLTLPMAEAIKRHDPAAHVVFCVQTYTAELVALSPHVDEILTIGARDIDEGILHFIRRLRRLPIDRAVFAYPRPKLALASLLAGIDLRIGTGYRWYSLLFNRKLREHRRDSRFHERDYNLHLLDASGIPASKSPLTPKLHISDELRGQAREVLERSGIDPLRPFIALHPGSGGSAKDWPPERFGALAEALQAADPELQIFITGTEAEHALMKRVRDAAGGSAAGSNTAGGSAAGSSATLQHEEVSLPLLAALLERSRLCCANSTGPLHIAAAVGTPVLGFYPFETVCHPRRWGPLGRHVRVLTPEPRPDCAACDRGDCPLHDDMLDVTVDAALEAARELLAETATNGMQD